MYTVKFMAGRDVNASCDTLADAVLIASKLSSALGQNYDVKIWQGEKELCLFRGGKEVF